MRGNVENRGVRARCGEVQVVKLANKATKILSTLRVLCIFNRL